MLISRLVLAAILLLLGGLMAVVHRDLVTIDRRIATIETEVAGIKLQRATAYVGKPRSAPIRHLYKKPPTVVDQMCKPTS